MKKENIFLEFFNKNHLQVVPRKDNVNLWNEVIDSLPLRPVKYLNSSIDYYIKYLEDQGEICDDISCVILSDSKPIGLWPLSVSKKKSPLMLSSHGNPVVEPLFVKCPKKTFKNNTKKCFTTASQIADSIGLKDWVSSSSMLDKSSVSYWHQICMSSNASLSSFHELYIDLELPIEKIKSNFRKSYKPLVSLGEKLWKIDVINQSSLSAEIENHVNEFCLLHEDVSGKKTRSTESWNFQKNAILNSEAFLICLRDDENKLIGAGYFSHTSDQGVYAIAAYDRNLFQKPLGHTVQYAAIKELKKIGCKWYHLGRRSYKNDLGQPTDKEISISKFKEGFSTNIFPSFELKIPSTL